MPSELSRQIFESRTALHISLVGKYMRILEGYLDLSRSELESRAAVHDLSKYSELEREGYTLLTWRYYCRTNRLSLIEEPRAGAQIQAALDHHRRANRHHPEAHSSPADMTDLDLIEMVCDWAAIAEENGGSISDCRQWAVENIDRKWTFPETARAKVFSAIDEIERRLTDKPGCRSVSQSRLDQPRD